MAKEIIDRFHQFALTEKERKTVSFESSDVLSSIKECEVQVWNIPLHWMSTDVGHKIENALGGMVDIVIPENGSKEGQYMRLKVRINITKPLPRGHNDKTCTQRAKDIQEGKAKVDQFG